VIVHAKSVPDPHYAAPGPACTKFITVTSQIFQMFKSLSQCPTICSSSCEGVNTVVHKYEGGNLKII
jgi:hypothetical protein